MTRCSFIFVLVILLASNVTGDATWSSDDHKPLKPINVSSWDLLESIGNSISSSIGIGYSLWDSYAGSSRSYRPTGVKTINQMMTDKEYVKSRIQMAGAILLGPESWSTLYSVTPRERRFIDQDLQCIHSTMTLFAKHCGFRSQYRHMHRRPFKNLCNHVSDRTKIEEAFIVSCGSKNIENVVNVNSLSIEVTPTPLDGSSEYCERVFVNGVSRLKLWSFAKIYRGLLITTNVLSYLWHDRAQICFHKNPSLEMCQCEKDDWRPFKDGVLTFVLSPYKNQIIDIKFNSRLSGSLSISIHEVSQGWRYVFLVVGIALLLAPVVSKNALPIDVDDVVPHPLKLVIFVIGVTCIFQSSIDTPLAIVAVVTCLALYYVIRCIRAPLISKKPKLMHCCGQET